MTKAYVDPGSFRDPRGNVYLVDDRVYRTVMPPAAPDFDFVRSTGLLDELIAEGLLLPATHAEPYALRELAADAHYILQHPRLPFISYPYEWTFSGLQAAALLHLDVHLKALERGVTLSDATAYNIQFQSWRPVFIDHLSFRRYRQGEFWVGHRQFCQQFLNPLLLRAMLGVPHNAWYRGSQEGITTSELNPLIPMRRKLSWNVFMHIVLQAFFERKVAASGRIKLPRGEFPLTAFKHVLTRLRRWIGRLNPADTTKSAWSNYANAHGYTPQELERKRQAVADFVSALSPQMIWDLGCHTGDYSKVALASGAHLAIGFDFDQPSLEVAFARARSENLAFLPLSLDVANPSPSQGWAQAERKGLLERATADALIALAFIHHLALARNIPLPRLADWLVRLAPNGLVEFVGKSDPMAQQLLGLREDVFSDYTVEYFLTCLEKRAQIVKTIIISSHRRLIWFRRR